MKLPSNIWPRGEAAQTHLFIVQLMQQALDDQAFESFRVPSLDMVARLREAASIARDVLSERVHHAALELPLRELSNSLRKSAEFVEGMPRYHADVFCSKYESATLTKKSEVDRCFRECATLYQMTARHYKTWLERSIIKTCKNKSNRISLRYLVYEYCSHLINSGYSKQYIKTCLSSKFYLKKVSKIEKRTLPTFFSNFDVKTRKYRVWLPIDKQAADYLSNAPIDEFYVVDNNAAPNDVTSAFANASISSTHAIASTIPALDPFTAAETARLVIRTVGSIGLLNRKSVEVAWPTKAYVKAPRVRNGIIANENNLKLQPTTKIVRGKTGKALKRQTHALLTEFNEESAQRLIATVRTAALARTSTSPENQLVSLWSAVEVLFGYPPSDLPRIKYYISQLTPLACHRYARTYASAILDELLVQYGLFIRKLLREVDSDFRSDQYSKFCRLLFETEYEDQRNRLMSHISQNPLALHKVWKLWDNFKTPLNYRDSLQSHIDRVSWQISRIYRTRNGLVHNGRSPPYLRALTLNAFEYFRLAVVSVLENGMIQSHSSDMRQIISAICFEQEVILKRLREMGNEQMTYTDDYFREFFFEGKRTKISAKKKSAK